ncbi:MAG: hypothetical protein ACYDH6_07515 [Acidimicrobiales bacterium]
MIAGVGTPLERIELTDKGRRFVTDELVRASLALIFAAIFVLTIGVSAFSLDDSKAWPNTKEWLQVLLPAETALIGSATGFSFGTRK